jgi:hypothetical protein
MVTVSADHGYVLVRSVPHTYVRALDLAFTTIAASRSRGMPATSHQEVPAPS